MVLKMIKLTKEELNKLKASVWIGKSGISEQLYTEINSQLKGKGYIKVKILKSIRDKYDQILDQILSNTNSKLVSKIGLTFILVRKENGSNQ